MLTNNKKSLLTVLAVSIIMSIMRTVVILDNIESKNITSDIYFLDESASVISFAIVTLVFVVLFFAIAFRSGRKRACSFPANTLSVNVASIICSFALLGESIIYLIFVLGKNPSFGTIDVSTFNHSGLDVAVIIFSLISAIYFFYVGFAGHSSNNNLLAIGALMPIFTAVFRLLADFVRQSTTPLASSGAYNILSIIALMLFLLAEGKTIAGVGSAFMVTFTGYSSILLLMTYSLPNLLIHSFWFPSFNYITAFSIVDLCFVIYVSIRLFTLKTGEAGSLVKLENAKKEKRKNNAENIGKGNMQANAESISDDLADTAESSAEITEKNTKDNSKKE